MILAACLLASVYALRLQCVPLGAPVIQTQRLTLGGWPGRVGG